MLGLYDRADDVMGVGRIAALAASQAQGLFGSSSAPNPLVLVIVAATLCATWLAPNTIALAGRFRPSTAMGLLAGAALAFSLLSMHSPTEFLYFNF